MDDPLEAVIVAEVFIGILNVHLIWFTSLRPEPQQNYAERRQYAKY